MFYFPPPVKPTVPQVPQWGITPALNTLMPSEEERHKSDKLESFLKDVAGVYETREEVDHRKLVLGEIHALACKWVKSIVGKPKCCLFTSGSYRMGVGGPGADIDALIVTPREINRNRFFTDWIHMLQERKEYVEKAVAVPGAFVPIIKCLWRGVDIDLLFSTMDQSAITPNLDPSAEDDRVLEFVHDEPSVRSLNGVRVADRILRLVPSIPVFRVALRFVKHWAKRRGIYSNSVGYLGGVAWAILVARICQLLPNACTYIVAKQFFCILSQWSWPNPVLLTHPSDAATRLNNGAALSMPQWNSSVNYRDRKDFMPILTPAFPSQNCTYNVSRSTFFIICNELKRGAKLMSEIDSGQNFSIWEELCEPTPFFTEFKRFIRVDAFIREPSSPGSTFSFPSPSSSRQDKGQTVKTATGEDQIDYKKSDDIFKEEEKEEEKEEDLLYQNLMELTSENENARPTSSKKEWKDRMQQLLTVGIADMDEFMIDEQRETYQEKESSDLANRAEIEAAEVEAVNHSDVNNVDARNDVVALTEYERDAWLGWVESRLRFLTVSLEYTLHIDYAKPFPKPFSEESANIRSYFFGIKFALKNKVIGQKTAVNLCPAIADFKRRVDVQRTTPLVGCRVTHVKQHDLPEWVNNVKKEKMKKEQKEEKEEKVEEEKQHETVPVAIINKVTITKENFAAATGVKRSRSGRNS